MASTWRILLRKASCVFQNSKRQMSTVLRQEYSGLGHGSEPLASSPSISTSGEVGRASFVASALQMDNYNEIENVRGVSSHQIEVNGTKISYQKTGSGKKTLLLLPGALGSSTTDFKPQIEGLNKDMFTLVAWDPRGYGHSRQHDRDWPDHFLERDALDATQLMENLEISKYSLLGWSDGGITALIMAARNPDKVKKLVVWGSNSYVTPEEIDSYEKIKDIDNWSPRMRQPFIDLYGEEYFRTQWAKWVEAFSSYLHKHKGNICSDELSKIQCPTLIVHGQKDPLVPQFHPDHLHKEIKNSRLYNIPEGKHNLHLRLYKEFNSVVESFLAEPH